MSNSFEQWEQFTDAQEWLFQPSKRSNMGSAFLVGCRFDYIQWFSLKLQNIQIWNVTNSNRVYLLIIRNCILRLRNVQIWAVSSCKRVDMLMPKKSVFRVWNVEIWAVLSSSEDDLLMLRNRVFMVWNAQKCAVLSSKEAILLKLRKVFSAFETFKYASCSPGRWLIWWYSGILF